MVVSMMPPFLRVETSEASMRCWRIDQRWRMPVRYKLVDERPKTFVLVFATDDELSQGLKKFASDQKLTSASFKGIGALSSVKLGWLDWETKKYEPSVSLDEQVELLSVIGDVALKDGEPQVHAHIVIGK
jgi:uncharacterized protein